MKRVAFWTILVCGVHAPARAAELVHQDIAVDVTSATLRVVVDATVAVSPGETGLWVFTPSLVPSVFTVNGSPTQMRPISGVSEAVELPLDVGTPALEGEARVHLEMEGVLTCDQGGRVVCVQSAADTALVPAAFGAAWYLQNVVEADPFDLDIAVTAPEDREVIAGSGSPLEVGAPSGGVRVWRYGAPVPVELLMLYARPGARVQSQGGFEVVGMTPDRAATRERMQRAVDLGGQLMPIFGEMLGSYTGERAHLLAMPRSFVAGGIGLLGTVLFGEFVVDDLDYLLEQGTAHELGHTWWGGLASAPPRSPHGGFMQEAFAEYTAWNGLGRIQGDAARTSGVRMNAVWYMYRRPTTRDLAILDPQVQGSNLYVFVAYHKASVVLRALEERAGQDVFLRALRRLQGRGAGGLTPEAFLEDLATEAGPAVRTAAETWLNTPGFPSLVVATTTTRTPGGTLVGLDVARSGGFPMELPLQFILEGGERVARTVSLEEDALHLDVALEGTLVALEVDPAWTMPREVTPAVLGDVTMDGQVDAADVMEVVLRQGTYLPDTRREDGAYDPLFDVDLDRRVDEADADAVLVLAQGGPAGGGALP